MEKEDKTLGKKIYDIFVRIAAGTSVSMLLLSLSSIFFNVPINICSIAISLGVGIIPTYIGLTVLRNKIHNSYVKDMHMFEQLTRGIEEFKKDKNVEHEKVLEGMAIYYSFITRKDKNNVIPESDYNTINSFLFMINENYYEKINNRKRISRTMLIESIIMIIIGETRPNEPFDEQVAERVINRAFFIDERTKKEMIKEFSSAKTKVINGPILYRIVSSKMSTKSIEEKIDNINTKKDDNASFEFRIEDAECYERLLKQFAKNERNKYGDLTKIEFDFELIKEIVCMIVIMYGNSYKDKYPKYDKRMLASTLLYESAIYAVVNNIKKVGLQEILNTLKNYHYLNFEDKIIIADAIFLNFDITGINHPFRKDFGSTIKQPTLAKIIPFPTKR